MPNGPHQTYANPMERVDAIERDFRQLRSELVSIRADLTQLALLGANTSGIVATLLTRLGEVQDTLPGEEPAGKALDAPVASKHKGKAN